MSDRKETTDEYLDRKEDELVRHPLRKGIKWTAIVLIVGGIIGGIIWAIGISTSKPAGQANAYREKNASSNWTQQQARFQQLFGNVRQADEQLTTDQADLDAFKKAHPNYAGNGQPIDPLLDQMNTLVNAVKADRSSCTGNQNDYEVLGRTYTAEDFRDHGLPQTFDAGDPGWNGTYVFTDYDCKPNGVEPTSSK